MFEQAFKNIDDVLWKEAGCTTELDYTEQISWLLFLKYLDGLEQDRAGIVIKNTFLSNTDNASVSRRRLAGCSPAFRSTSISSRRQRHEKDQ
jgi:hypothetical protein